MTTAASHHGPTLEGKTYWARYFHELLVRDPETGRYRA